MSTSFGEAWWNIAQAAILASLGIAAIKLFARRTPAAAAAVGFVSLGMILATTACIPLSFPEWPKDSPLHEAASRSAGNAEIDQTNASLAASDSFPVPSLSADWKQRFAALRDFVSTISVADDRASEAWTPLRITLVFYAAGAVVGLIRLTLAAAFTFNLRRSAKPIDDALIQGYFFEICQQLQIRRPAELCESANIASPALIGWRRPLVLLPVERTGWTEDQLRATLAHEAAHLARGDFSRRVVAQLTVAIHFCQPLVHWLVRRQTLMQELATDRLAAPLAGGSRRYSRALSELALQLDDHARLRAEPLVLPALSNQFARRMNMLRSQEEMPLNSRHSWRSALAAGLIVSAAVATTALRSIAEEPAAASPTTGVDRPLFGREKPDLSFFGSIDLMLLVLQVDDLTHIAECAPAVAAAERFLNEHLTDLPTKSGAPLKAELAEIDYIAYALRRVTPEEIAQNPVLGVPGENSSTVMAELAIRWVEAIDAATWLTEHISTAEKASEGGISCIRLQMGDEPDAAFYLAQRDPHTVVATYSIERLRVLLADGSEGVIPSERQDAVNGGLAMMCLNTENLPGGIKEVWAGPPLWFLGASAGEGEPDYFEISRQTICDETREIWMGWDVDPVAHQIAGRVTVACDDEAAARLVLGSVQLFQQVSKSMNDQAIEFSKAEELGPMSEEEQARVHAMMLGYRILGEASLEVRNRDEAGADLWVELNGELPPAVLTYWTSQAKLEVCPSTPPTQTR